MLEEELYEPMRAWLEQYLTDKYKGHEIIVVDAHSERLDRALAKYDIVNEMANGVDIQIDVLDRFLDFHGQDVLMLYSTLILNSSSALRK